MGNWITSRLSEPSTWAGLGVIVTTLGPIIFPAEWTTIKTVALPIVSALAGVVAVAAPEKGIIPAAK